MKYGLPEYKALLEKNLHELHDPMSAPFGSDPFAPSTVYGRQCKRESINYALEMLPEVDPDAERYRKLRRWMTSNVKEGWDEVVKLGAVGVYIDWDTFDAELDRLPVCNVGLCEVPDNERS